MFVSLFRALSSVPQNYKHDDYQPAPIRQSSDLQKDVFFSGRGRLPVGVKSQSSGHDILRQYGTDRGSDFLGRSRKTYFSRPSTGHSGESHASGLELTQLTDALGSVTLTDAEGQARAEKARRQRQTIQRQQPVSRKHSSNTLSRPAKRARIEDASLRPPQIYHSSKSSRTLPRSTDRSYTRNQSPHVHFTPSPHETSKPTFLKPSKPLPRSSQTPHATSRDTLLESVASQAIIPKPTSAPLSSFSERVRSSGTLPSKSKPNRNRNPTFPVASHPLGPSPLSVVTPASPLMMPASSFQAGNVFPSEFNYDYISPPITADNSFAMPMVSSPPQERWVATPPNHIRLNNTSFFDPHLNVVDY